MTSSLSRGFCGDYVACLKDEIALEGLDGITFQALWERLLKRPGFVFIPDIESKEYIWNHIKVIDDLEFYLLPEKRNDLSLYTRKDFVDSNEFLYEPLSVKDDIYEYKPIEVVDGGVLISRGSCPTFYERKNITGYIRKNKLSFSYLNQRFENGFVIVASQTSRNNAIFGNTIPAEINVVQYCIIERIARSRYEGEPTRGKVSLNMLKIDPKALFYQRKLLMTYSCIKKQNLMSKFGPNRSTTYITLFHLPRFYNKLESGLGVNFRKVLQVLLSRPYFRIETAQIKARFGKYVMALVQKPEYSSVFHTEFLAHSKFYPELYEQEKSGQKREKMTKRVSKCTTLLVPDKNIEEIVQMLIQDKEKEEQDPADEEDGLLDCVVINTKVQNQSTLYSKCIDELVKSGSRGLSIVDMINKIPCAYLEARTLARYFTRQEIVISIAFDHNKTKVNRFIIKKFKDDPPPPRELESISIVEPIKMLNVNENVNPIILNEDQIVNLQHQPFEQLESHHDNEISNVILHDGGQVEEYHTMVPTLDESTLVEVNDGLINPNIMDVVQINECQPDGTIGFNVNMRNLLALHKGESNEFVSLDNEHSIKYETTEGWEVTIHNADVNTPPMKIFYETQRKIFREQWILNEIKKYKIVVGFLSIVKGIRACEEEMKTEDKVTADRKSLLRIVKKLKYEHRLNMWKIRVSKNVVARVCTVFTEYDFDIMSPLLGQAAEILVYSLQRNKNRITSKLEQIQKKALYHKAKMRARENFVGNSNNRRRKEKKLPNLIPIQMQKQLKRKKVKRSKPQPFMVVNPDLVSVEPHGHSPRRRPLHDDKDLEAIARKRSQRVDWTVDEDNVVLSLLVSSIVFNPKYQINKVFVFNGPQIRDLLHQILPSSDHKTSASIRGRIHKLMKKTEVFKKYSFLLDDILTDSNVHQVVLATKVVQKKDIQAKDKLYVYGKIPDDALKNVFSYFYKKHYGDGIFENPENYTRRVVSRKTVQCTSTNKNDEEEFGGGGEVVRSRKPVEEKIEMPNEDLIENAKVEPKTSDELDRWIARGALLSIVFTREKMPSLMSFIDCLDDDVLDQTILGLRSTGIAVILKTEPRFNISLAIRRMLIIHLRPTMFRKGYKLLHDLKHNGISAESEPDLRQLVPVSILAELSLTKLKPDWNLMLPDTALTVSDEWAEIFKTAPKEPYPEPESDSESEEERYEAERHKRNQVQAPRVALPEEEALELDEETYASHSSGGLESRVHIFSMQNEEIRQRLSAKKNREENDSSDEEEELDPKAKEKFINTRRTKMAVSDRALRLSRSKLSTKMRAQFNQSDFFKTNIPRVSVTPHQDTKSDEILPYEDFHQDIIYKVKEALVVIVPGIEIFKSFPVKFLCLYQLIEKTEEAGLSLFYLKAKFDKEYLKSGLNSLLEKRFIFLVGVMDRKFISQPHVTKWTMPIPIPKKDKSSSNRAIRVVMHHWITCSGNLNFRILDRLLISILGHLSEKPLTHYDEICELMNPIISNVDCFMLLQILYEYRLINVLKFDDTELENIGIFQEAGNGDAGDKKVDFFLDIEEAEIECTENYMTKYTDLQSILNPSKMFKRRLESLKA